MDCNHVRSLLPGYVDGELDLRTALEIEEHLNTCAACAGEYARMLALQSAFANQRAALRQPAPADLRRRVQTSLRKSGGETGPLGWLRRAPRFATAITAVALIGLVVLVTLGVWNGWWTARKDIVAEEVEIAHVRSLMADHLTDVVSTDQHTVKPWFDGRLDFSPPVVDLAAQGFLLTGGRLDYIDGHPAAALIYLRNKHVINLFIWPAPGPADQPRETTLNGYHLVQWSQAGMAFWAVSDLESGELLNFVHWLQKST